MCSLLLKMSEIPPFGLSACSKADPASLLPFLLFRGGIQYSHREIPISPARLGDPFCCLGDFLSFHGDNRYSQRDAQVTQRDVVMVHRACHNLAENFIVF